MRVFRAWLAGLALAVGMPGGMAAACELTFGWESWPPYQMEGDNGPKGLDIALVKHIGARADCAITFTELPWKRLLTNIERGEVDGAMAAAKTEERAAYGHFTKPYRNETVGLMVRADDKAIQEMDSLREILESDRTVGLWRDYFYGETVEKLREQDAYADNFRVLDRGSTLLRMVAGKRFDATLGDPVADTYTARQMGIADKLVAHDVKVMETPVHLLLSRQSVDMATVQRLNAAIDAAKADGSLAKLVDRYLQS